MSKMNKTKIYGYICWDACIVALIESKEMEYWLLFAQTFQIRYNHNDDTSDRKISNKSFGSQFTSGMNGMQELANELFGLEINEIKANSKDELVELVKQQLAEGKSVGVVTNVYWCNWSVYYKKTFNEHIILVTSIQGEEVVCVDNMLSDGICKMKYCDFVEGITGVRLYSFMPRNKINYKAVWEKSLLYTMQVAQKEEFNQFIQDFPDHFNMEKEFEAFASDGWSSIFWRNLFYYISGSRVMYSCFLQNMGMKLRKDAFLIATDMLNVAENKWKRLSMLFIRFYNEGTYNMKGSIEALQDIYQYEKGILDFICKNIGV